MSTTDMTTPEPMTADSTALRAVLANCDAALDSYLQQMDRQEARIAGYRERQSSLHTQRETAERTLDDLATQIRDCMEKHIQARTAASIATGTAMEASQQANVERIRAELASLQGQHEDAQKQYSKADSARRKEEDALATQISADEEELTSLRETASALIGTREQTHAQLGAVIYRELETTLRELEAQEEHHRNLAGEAHVDALNLRYGFREKLAAWPDLQKRAEQFVPQPEVKDDATTRVLKATLAHIAALFEDVNRVEPLPEPELQPHQQWIIKDRMFGLIGIKGFTRDILWQQRHDVEAWLSQHQAELESRAKQARQRAWDEARRNR